MQPRTALLLVSLFALPSIAYGQDDKDLADRLSRGDRRALQAAVQRGEAILPELAKLLADRPRDENQSLMTYAVAEIARDIGPKAKGATTVLCTLLKSPDKAVASDAARALGSIGAGAAPDVVKTLKAVEHDTEKINALRALRQMNAGAKSAAPDIVAELKKNTSPHVRLAALDALGAIGPSGKATVDALLELGKDNKKALYTAQLIITLGTQAGDGKAAIAYLADIVKDAPETHLKLHAMESMTKISPSAKETGDALARLLDTPHVPKVMVLESLAKGGPPSKDVVKSIENMMRDKDAGVRLQAALVVGKSNANHPAVVSILIESLQAKDARTRLIAAEAIGNLGPKDEAVIEGLQSRANDNDPAVKKAVATALEKFKKK